MRGVRRGTGASLSTEMIVCPKTRRVGGVRPTGHSTFLFFVEFVVGHENRVTVASAFFVVFYIRPALMLFMTDVNKFRGNSLQTRFYSCHSVYYLNILNECISYTSPLLK